MFPDPSYGPGTVLRSRRVPTRGGLTILGIGTGEVLIIIALALILFGPERLMEISRTLGRATREVRRSIAEVREEIEETTRVESERDDR